MLQRSKLRYYHPFVALNEFLSTYGGNETGPCRKPVVDEMVKGRNESGESKQNYWKQNTHIR